MAATQQNRSIQVFTPLADDTLLLYRMHGQEALSEPFEYQVELLSTNANINPDSLLGKNLTIALEMGNGKQRYFSGCVTRFGQYRNVNEYAYYRAEVRPWLWFLTRASNCRIFQNKTAPDIIQQVFRDQGLSDFKLKLNGSYSSREYCVQYRETDFNFVSRLMEEEGIYYYFSHERGKHTLTMAVAAGAHTKYPGYEKIPFIAEDGVDRTRVDHIHEWGFACEVQTGAYALTDYDFKKPKANLLVKSKIKRNHAHAEHEFFDYPGRYIQTGVGDNFVRQRVEQKQAGFERCEAKCNARGLSVGYSFQLEDYPRKDQNREYLVVSAEFHLSMDLYFSGRDNYGPEKVFDCSFTAQNFHTPYRHPQNTRKPLVHGAQTAVVVGPSAEEIYTDKYGRVKVHFHWDRFDHKDENSSCWIRVAHPWAGKNWGMVAIPRIGHEVVIEFLEGDPDQPLIVGSVYNDENMPPYGLPGNATQTGILTRSSKNGSSSNFNELRFEDKKGSEQVFLHAEKNQDIEVENDESHWVGHDRSKTIDHDETTHVKHDRTETVDNNESITIGVNRTESVGSDESISIGRNREETVGANETIDIGKDRTETVGVNESVTIGKNQTLEVGENRETTIGKDDKSQVGKKFYLDAGDEITLKTGDASITMKKDGTIQIKGKDITIIGSGKISAKASGDMVLKGSKIAEN